MQVGQVLMTIAIAQFGVIPIFADINRSHALNPEWPPHARFHVLAQVLTSSLVAAFSLAVLWWPGLEPGLGANLAALGGMTVLAGFFGSVAACRLVGGASAAPGAARLGGLDGNIVNFGVAALLLIGGWLLLRQVSA